MRYARDLPREHFRTDGGSGGPGDWLGRIGSAGERFVHVEAGYLYPSRSTSQNIHVILPSTASRTVSRSSRGITAPRRSALQGSGNTGQRKLLGAAGFRRAGTPQGWRGWPLLERQKQGFPARTGVSRPVLSTARCCQWPGARVDRAGFEPAAFSV